MSCVLVIDSNLIDERVSFAYSSQLTAYPASNALDVNRRRKVWRSAGFWKIETGSNTLVIRDAVAGADLTATVAIGTYATDALFFAALKTALEAVSDSTFTITRDATTNAIKITAVLAGAASAFLIRGAAAGSANFAPIIGFALTNISGALFYIADVVKIHTSEFLQFDFGFPVSPTAVLGFADKNRTLRISLDAVITLKGNLTNDFTTPLVSEVLTVADYAIGLADPLGIGGTACRHWQVEIIDPSNAFGYVELGALIIGTHAVLTRGSADFPLDADDTDLSQQEFSEGGQLVTSKRAQTQSIDIFWNGLDGASLEILAGIFETYGTHSVFAVILDGEDAFSTEILLWSKLVRMAGAPRKKLVSSNNWQVNWNLREDL